MPAERSALALRLPDHVSGPLERLIRRPSFEQVILGVIIINAIRWGWIPARQ